MGAKKKERFPCDRCGKTTSRNIYKEELQQTLCENCFKFLSKHPFEFFPPPGEMGYDSNGRVVCHICGRGGFDKLTCHLTQAHDISAYDYKERFGLKYGQKLTSISYSKDCADRVIASGIHSKFNILDYNKRTQFKKTHSISSKPRRLQVKIERAKLLESKPTPKAVSPDYFLKKRRKEAKKIKLQEKAKEEIKKEMELLIQLNPDR